MKKGSLWLIVIALVFLITYIGMEQEKEKQQQLLPVMPTEETVIQDVPTFPTVEVPETTLPAVIPRPTAPAHTELYLPGYTTEQVWEYFEEVVFHMEYTDDTSNESALKKWLIPLRYRIYGNATREDMAVLTELFAQLNKIPGFPGIYAAADGEQENLSLSFMTREELTNAYSERFNGDDFNGATWFWFHTDTMDFYRAEVGYLTEMDQRTRSSILVEEIVNTLGLTDTVHRTDSIVYQYSDDNMTLSDMDWLLLKLLYHPQVQCGMDADSCKAVIEALYH